jgi:hypothetical protein
MFASEEAVAANQLLKAEAARESRVDIEWIHVSRVRKDRGVKAMLKAAYHVLPSRLRKRLKRSISLVTLTDGKSGKSASPPPSR